MDKKISFESISKKAAFCFILIFSVCCLKLCAEDMSPAEAQVARDTFIAEAKKYVGCPYSFGAIGPDAFDCSGLIYYTASKSVGIQLPRTAKAIYNYCRKVPDKDREPGDLLFFKTTGNGSISHVGIYIGNNQFISAISDGPNTGVIISSLKQDYWVDKYVSAGQFIRSGKDKKDPVVEEEVVTLDKPSGKTKTQQKKSLASNVEKPETFADGLIFDAAVFVDWSLISPNQFMFKYRGIDAQINARYSGWLLQPGIGLDFRFNSSQGMFQIPILISATINDYVRAYAGPVISFGNGTLIGTDKEISPSVFPGIIGASFTTPFIEAGKVKLQLIQDISYTVFNNIDNSALNLLETISAGLVMYTGVKITLPLSNLK